VGLSPNSPQQRLQAPALSRLRSDFRRRHKEARLGLAQRLADAPRGRPASAEELYYGLCAENPEDERLWTALFRIHERTGSALGLEGAPYMLLPLIPDRGSE
jgi:hypothetical protein